MPDARPNILWYCADQLRGDAIGPAGNPYVRTPSLDRLARMGTTFTKAYCQAPICTPSRASFLTGKYPSSIPLNCNGNATFPDTERLVTRRLADVGYDCGLVGKLHLAGAANGREVRTDDGYRYFKYSHAPRNNWSRGHDYVDWIRAKGVDPDSVLTVKTNTFGDLMEPSAEKDNVPPDLHQTTWATEASLDFLKEERTGPWLLSVNVYDPHPPFNPPWEYYKRYDPESLPGPIFQESDLAHQTMLQEAGVDFQSSPRRPEQYGGKKLQAAYYAMIEMVDEHFGKILDHLEQTGELSNTIVIFSTDHGESCGDHGLTQKGPRFFEGMVNVPLMMALPGKFKAGLKSDALVELTDIMPTLMECVGLPIPEDVQGRSLLPILTGAASPHEHRDFVRTECYSAFDMPNRTFATMYRERRWKLVVYHGVGVGELYDMEADPQELTSLWDSPEHQSVKTELLLKSYDATIATMPYGPPLVMPY